MKKLLFGLIIVLPLVLGGVLYGTHNLVIEEDKAISLEQAYLAQFLPTVPDMVVDPPMDYIAAY